MNRILDALNKMKHFGTQSQKKSLLFLLLPIGLFFFIALPTQDSLEKIRSQFKLQEKRTTQYRQMEHFLTYRNGKSIKSSMTLVRFLEEAAQQLGLADKMLRVEPLGTEVRFEMDHVTLSEALLLFSVIEKAPPVGKVSFLKLIPKDGEALHFFVQVRIRKS